MERRDFLKAVAASGALTAMPVLADEAAPALIVCQSDAAGAATLAAGVAAALRAAGMAEVPTIYARGHELCQLSRIDAVLARGADRYIVGVMDDAAAVIFQEVAAARGAGYLVQGQHRFGACGVRHACAPSGLETALAWSDPLTGWEAQVARLYAGILAGDWRPGVPREPWVVGEAALAHAKLVSFVLNA